MREEHERKRVIDVVLGEFQMVAGESNVFHKEEY